MIKSYRKALQITVAATALLGAASAAQAGGFALREQSAAGQGMSFAGVGAGAGGLSSMFWNPAAVTQTPGWNSEWVATGILPYASINPTLPNVTPLVGSQVGEAAFLASGYTNYQINDRWYLGLSTGAPFGLSTRSSEIWGAQAYGTTSKVFSFNVNPVVGWKVNDWLAIAVGPQIQYFEVRLRGSTTAFGPGGSNILAGNNIGAGVTAGIMLTPWQGTRIGLGYRSAISHALEGGLQAGGPAVIPIRTKVTLPEIVTLGVSQDYGPWTANLGLEWTNWSRLKTSDVFALNGAIIPAAKQNYMWRDGWFLSGGVEYRYSPQWTFRGGVAYEWSPVTTAVRSVRLPDTNRIWASLGFSYKYSERLSFDVGYTHIFGTPDNIFLGPGNPSFIAPLLFTANTRAHVDILSVGVKYRWDTPAAAVVAKY
ncbi:outer membrane protein transport protein [Methylocella sp. CPCC 101449]|uniref:OmpP1/FadL family transporter n=1 Tax=Methylocella sp. CPCC 101449 TaxID=2987531 RepID=UPI00288CE69F|nr:outer membrane protein transport protein [Methylocella sp. CPCC 101449]MDT2021610.1 outer membrane protein transport protein [Methylocella sp. CPCC 101449]